MSFLMPKMISFTVTCPLRFGRRHSHTNPKASKSSYSKGNSKNLPHRYPLFLLNFWGKEKLFDLN